MNIDVSYKHIDHDTDFIQKYTETIYSIISPLSRQGTKSKDNCDKLLYLYMKINNLYHDDNDLSSILNKLKSDTDIFNSKFKIPSNFMINISKHFKSSRIQSPMSDLYKIFYDLMDFINTNNLSKLCTGNISGAVTGDLSKSIYPLYIHSNIKENDINEQRIVNSKKYHYKTYNKDIQQCIKDQKLIIGFIDIFTQYRNIGFIDHKNSIIIDSKNNIIIRFEPKPKPNYVLGMFLGVMSRAIKPTRYPMNTEIIKERLREIIGDKIDTFSIITIYGGQSNISHNHDWEYCVLYSLYSCLLFSKNYKFMHDFNKNYQVIKNNDTSIINNININSNPQYVNSYVRNKQLLNNSTFIKANGIGTNLLYSRPSSKPKKPKKSTKKPKKSTKIPNSKPKQPKKSTKRTSLKHKIPKKSTKRISSKPKKN